MLNKLEAWRMSYPSMINPTLYICSSADHVVVGMWSRRLNACTSGSNSTYLQLIKTRQTNLLPQSAPICTAILSVLTCLTSPPLVFCARLEPNPCFMFLKHSLSKNWSQSYISRCSLLSVYTYSPDQTLTYRSHSVHMQRFAHVTPTSRTHSVNTTCQLTL